MNSFTRAVGFAVSGLQLAFRHHPNIQRQLCIGVLAVVLGFSLNISVIEWMILTLTITMVFVAEFMNTVIEEVVDLITSEEREQAKVAKDIAAGMVLLTSIMSILIGALLFLPKLIPYPLSLIP